VLKNIKYRNLYEGNRRDISFHHKRKGAEEVRYQKYLNFQAKGPLPDRTLESFTQKDTDGTILIFRNNLTEAL
jgi:hypothetical protein